MMVSRRRGGPRLSNSGLLAALLELLMNSWTICKKDLRVWLRHPSNLVITLAPPLALLLVGALGSQAVGHSPVALVRLDDGPQGQRMARVLHEADLFRLQDVSASQAQALLTRLEVVAVITIPPDFTRRVQARDPAPLAVTINNLNLDFTSDIRRAVPDAITQFYAGEGGGSPFKIGLREHDLRARDIELFEYSVLPTIIFTLMIGGLVSGGLTTAREWETQTVKELLLAPVTRGALIAGKMLASFIPTFILGLLVLLLCSLAGWLHPEGIYWLSAALIIALLALFSALLGTGVGALVQRIQPVSPVAINVGMYLFFLAGGIGVLSFEPPVLQRIAAFIPLTYGRHALEMSIFYSSGEQFGRDVLVMGLAIVVAAILSVQSLRRGLRR